ncbi:hypothetical protein A2164_02720 [Candidatus Curtissbacteria bacterium RBG_13_35_7]|uniref:Methyltransferase type 11 domain-containing protein n=1 Tax=Candidatus Curtissbacteria bacterium RBG_13_35_7 TaxID=1797705 RepID=A0A1F5G4A8_9BACT|nr:MAG: hypothetical protein A2164_02720 [Candidatus Curtissbacteria bacterium RBG_13_35_7]
MKEGRLAVVESKRNFQDVIESFSQQAEVPPGNDLSIGTCYECLASTITEGSRRHNILSSIYKDRSTLTAPHFVNLFFRAIQYIQLFKEGNLCYSKFCTSEEWEPILERIFSAEYSDTLREIMLTKDTATTIYHRYAGPKFIISAFRNGAEVKVADLGCGANYGLRGIEVDEPFHTIADNTPNHQFTQLLDNQVNLVEGLAIDKQNPVDPTVRNWFIACSFYPKELDTIDYVYELEKKLATRSSKVRFLQEDLLFPSTAIAASHFDVVILSTLLYQYPEENRCTILAEAQRIIQPEGVIIIQDFAIKDPYNSHKLSFNTDWGKNQRGYRTFVMCPNSLKGLYEVLVWSDGRCHSVDRGQDYNEFLTKTGNM